MEKEVILEFIHNICLSYIYNFTREELYILRDIYEFIYLIIIDICNNEKVNIDDIKVIGKGNFSTVLKIGNKVLKIGNMRCVDKFPNNPYVNIMLLRHNFKINNKINFYIEVNEYVNTNILIEEDDLYNIYKNIRDLKLIWTDIKVENIGMLLKDNVINWQDKLYLTDDVLGLLSFVGDTYLKKGELVIIDNDLIYEEDSPNIIMSNKVRAFEKRYQKKDTRVF